MYRSILQRSSLAAVLASALGQVMDTAHADASSFAQSLFWGFLGGGQSIFGGAVSNQQLKTGDVHLSDIANMIVSATEWVIGFSATVAVFAIVFGALQLSIGSGAFGGGVDGRSKGKDAVKYGVMGFIMAVSSWFIVQALIANL